MTKEVDSSKLSCGNRNWLTLRRGSTSAGTPEDNRILELAVNGDAGVIVTGDKDLLVLDPFRGVRIVTPAEFLKL